MMRVWLWSAQTAVLFGTMFFALLFAPIVIWQYRRFGRWDTRRMLGAAAFSLYLTALATYTWLPLPDDGATWCAAHGFKTPQLAPLNFVADIRKGTAGLSWTAALTSAPVLQVVFNVMLFVPWGVIVRRYFNRGIAWATISGALVSVFVELTQYSGLWFVYPCAYRLADVDDVLMNTLGAFIGALIAPALLWWMPKARTLQASRLEPRPITVWRRWLGMIVDIAAWGLIGGTISFLIAIAAYVTGTAAVPVAGWASAAGAIAAWALVFIVPTFNGGGSLGQSAVWLYPRWPDASGRLGTGRWWQRVLRSSVLSVPLLASSLIDAGTSGTIALVISNTLVVIAVILVPFTANKRSLSCVVTGASMTDSREKY